MLSEADARMEIDEALKNKGWKLSGREKNVFAEKSNKEGRADYVLKPVMRKDPLIIIEAKRKGKDLNDALFQAQRYANDLKAPIAYASDGSTIKTVHLKTNKPLILNGEEVDHFINETLALQYLHTNEYNTLGKKVIQSRKELITIFGGANKELRKEGLQAGIERFSEFCNILFLKIFSEEVALAEETGSNLHSSIPKEFRWDYFKNKDGDELLYYVNDVVLRHFQREYGEDIFSALQLKNPVVLKKIIDDLDPLSLVDTNSDIKGDAFEYFLKAYLANQNKDLGEYFTPRHIVKTLVKLVNPRFGETVYDPFCGTGGMLIETFKHIYNKMPMSARNLDILKKETIFGGEITKNARITKMNMILTGDGHNNIVRQDSLKNPSVKKHDVVITNMPFSLGAFDDYSNFYKLGSPNGNSLCIEHCFDAINPEATNPRIGMIVPNGILFDKKYTRLREYIYKNSYVQDIVALPFEAFKPYAEVESSILYLTDVNKSRRKEQKTIWHFSVKNDGHALNTKRQKKDGENDLDLFLSFNGVQEDKLLEIGFNKLDMEKVANNNYVSIPNPYKQFDLKTPHDVLPLKKVVEEINLKNTIDAPVWSVTNDRGFIPTEEQFKEQVASDNTENYKLIYSHVFAYNPARLNVGSIAYNDTDIVGCVSPMYVTFKIKDGRVDPRYLFHILKSEYFLGIVGELCVGSVRKVLSFNKLGEIKIPIPKITEQMRIASELDTYESIIRSSQDILKRWNIAAGESEGKSLMVGDLLKRVKDTIQVDDSKEYRQITVKMWGKGVILRHIQRGKDIGTKRQFLAQQGQFIFSRIDARNGAFGIVPKELDMSIVSNDFPVFRIDHSLVIPEYFNFLINSQYFYDVFSQLSVGVTNRKRIDIEKFLAQKIIVPPLEKQKEIVADLFEEEKMKHSHLVTIKLFETKIQDRLKQIYESNL